jgi:hypothetical protein
VVAIHQVFLTPRAEVLGLRIGRWNALLQAFNGVSTLFLKGIQPGGRLGVPLKSAGARVIREANHE